MLPSPLQPPSSVSPLEADLMKRLISEMESKNKILQENKLLLEEKIHRLRAIVDDGESKRGAENTTLNVGDVLHELAEREKRRNNVIIFNLPETATSSDAQNAVDRESVANILNKFQVPLSGITFKHFRLGKFDSTKNPSKQPHWVNYEELQIA